LIIAARDFCLSQRLKIFSEIDEDILPLLTASESSNVFDVRDADLRGNNAKALFQSLQRQHSLSQLSLCGTNLYDEGVKVCIFHWLYLQWTLEFNTKVHVL